MCHGPNGFVQISIEKAMDHSAKITQDGGQSKLLLRSNDAYWIISVIYVSRLCGFVQHNHEADTCVEVLADLDKDLRPAVAGRTHFEDELWNDGKIAARQWPWRNAVEAVKGDVSATNCVGAVLGNHAGIVANDTSNRLGLQKLT